MNPFDMFFGGGQQGNRRSRNKGPDAELQMQVPLQMMFNGGQTSHDFERLIHCKGCKNKRTPECNKCRTRCPNEIRMVNRQIQPGFVVQQQQEVRSKEKCTMASVRLDVQIEKGAPDGEKIT